MAVNQLHSGTNPSGFSLAALSAAAMLGSVQPIPVAKNLPTAPCIPMKEQTSAGPQSNPLSYSTASNIERRRLSQIEAQRTHLLSLRYGWDGYDAQEINSDLLAQLITIVSSSLMLTAAISPDIIPGGDGSLQAEWHLANIELGLHLDADGFERTWIHHRDTGQFEEHFHPHGVEALRRHAPQLII